jgi:hypothetical protein
MSQSTNPKKIFLDKVKEKYGEVETLSRNQISEICIKSNGEIAWPRWLVDNPLLRARRNVFYIPWKTLQEIENSMTTNHDNSLEDRGTVLHIPDKVSYYTPFGFHHDWKKIVMSGLWCPVFVTGPSGCGKTTIIEQVAVETGRECFRVNITTETDEDDLLGGMRLIQGETKFRYGPVVEALARGAILLLDEIDYGSSKLACLQPVLEGKGVFIKKISKWIPAAKGFNVIATANTKGKGDESGRFAGTNVMNAAFLDRFNFCFEHTFPSKAIESEILESYAVKHLGKTMDENLDSFIEVLVEWSKSSRDAFEKESCDEVISTRRLTNAVLGYVIFNDRKKAINMCLSNYGEDSKKSLMQLYEALDTSIMSKEKQEAAAAAKAKADAAAAAKKAPFGEKMRF